LHLPNRLVWRCEKYGTFNSCLLSTFEDISVLLDLNPVCAHSRAVTCRGFIWTGLALSWKLFSYLIYQALFVLLLVHQLKKRRKREERLMVSQIASSCRLIIAIGT
jgi:hypothetical protein